MVCGWLVVSVAFIYSGVLHLRNPYQFYAAVLKYELLPPLLAQVTVALLPGLQILCGMGLVLNRWRPLCRSVLIGLTIVFLAAQAGAMARGLQIGCGCFGSLSSETIGWWTLARTSTFLFILVLTGPARRLWSRRSPREDHSVGQPVRRAFTLVELLVVLALVGVLLALLLVGLSAARRRARLAECSHQLRQLSLAAQQHVASHGTFPAGGWGYAWLGVSDRGFGVSQPGGWVFNLLPYIEAGEVRDLAPAAASPPDLESLRTFTRPVVPLLLCPDRSGPRLTRRSPDAPPFLYPQGNGGLDEFTRCDYAANAGNIEFEGNWPGPQSVAEGDRGEYEWDDPSHGNGVCFVHDAIRPAQIRDGLSHVILYGEKWTAPPDYIDNGNDQPATVGYAYDTCRYTHFTPAPVGNVQEGHYTAFGSTHAGVFLVAFCDGSVRPVDYRISPRTFRPLGGRDDGQVTNAPFAP